MGQVRVVSSPAGVSPSSLAGGRAGGDAPAGNASSTSPGRRLSAAASTPSTTITTSVEVSPPPGSRRRRRRPSAADAASAPEQHLSPPDSNGSGSLAGHQQVQSEHDAGRDKVVLELGQRLEGRPAKARKVSRACDFCKNRKAKCSGNRPCSKCVAQGRHCVYNAKYTRGRPPTPPPSVSFLNPDGVRSTASVASVSAEDSASVEPLAARHQHQQYPPQPQQPQHHHDHLIHDDINGLMSSASSSSQFARLSSSASHHQQNSLHLHPSGAPSRASPELGMAEIQGQVFDPTSGLTFLHRAWKRLSAQQGSAQAISDAFKTSSEKQHVTMAGDKPLPEPLLDTSRLRLASPADNRRLLALYFDVCIATYRFLHRPAVERWLGIVERNVEQGMPLHYELGHARAAIVLTALAIATTHDEKSKGFFSADDEARALNLSDELFCSASRLVDAETGFPKLESAQARLVQVLYLLTTSRFNKSWHVFCSALTFISIIGLHRRESSMRRRGVARPDYVQSQGRLRTFWTAYVLDNYLGVVFGRPRHFHDDDIDQDFPDRVNDEDMTALGPAETPENPDDCHIDALIFHARIAQIIGTISHDVYAIKGISEQERAAAAQRLIQRVNEWRSSLPLHLGSIRPSMLIPSYRRQATVLKLAYSHAIMHASRLFLLNSGPSATSSAASSSAAYGNQQVEDCIAAAKSVLETVDYMAREGPIFHAFWWTHYVTFCALVVIYIWEIQQRRLGRPVRAAGHDHRAKLLDLAERCHSHLSRATATNSPSRRYAVILEEFRTTARSQPSRLDGEQTHDGFVQNGTNDPNHESVDSTLGEDISGHMADDIGQMQSGPDQQSTIMLDPHLLDEWQTTDWLDLDSSAFWPDIEFDESMVWPGIG